MQSIDPAALSAKEVYKFFIGSIIPRPIAFVTTLTEGTILNGAPFSFFNIVSSDPPILSIAVQRKEMIQKDTARNIQQTKEFVIHICDEDNIEKINETAANFPSDISEIEEAKLQPVDSWLISTPGIMEAKIRIECKLEKIITINNEEGKPACDLILGRAVYFHISDDLYKDGKIDAKRLKPVSRMAGNDYSKLGETFTIERPKLI
ncbi:flavin reductase family protein [Niallia sp. 01092]|uniref:flavin reductase family protein n=1 Tax=unclassified Niallia TaxID=2837522 RepID=UPI003FD29637